MVREATAIVDQRRDLGHRLALCRKAAGLTQVRLAEMLYCDRTRVAHLENGRGSAEPRFWRSADDLLSAGGVLVQGEQDLRTVRVRAVDDREAAAVGRAQHQVAEWQADLVASAEPSTSSAQTEGLRSAARWVDERAGLPAGTSWRRVGELAARGRGADHSDVKRAGAKRSRLARVIARYYGTLNEPDVGTFAGRVGVDSLATTILTCQSWVGMQYDLASGDDRIQLRVNDEDPIVLDDLGADLATHRLVDACVSRTRMKDLPVYRLLDMQIDDDGLHGAVGLTSFVGYALTLDLLEGELTDAVGFDAPEWPVTLPLRERYLPDLASVLDVGGRLCAGGVLALCAIARPADPVRGPADFLILVQQRSGDVVNAGGSLAVIPKGFHAPLVDYRADAAVGATLRREMEEELFGRADVDGTEGPQRAADPMHRTRMSEPMGWLVDEPNRMRMEATGFGLNLISGNYEFASLIVIEDEEFWPRFGGMVAANWESASLRQYPTLDGELLAELAADEAWSNEGLFAFTLGLRRLQELWPDRVTSMPIEWELT